MANLDFYATPFVEFNDTKIFGTADTSAHFAKVFGDNAAVQRTLSALQRGPVRFYRGSVIALDEDVADYLLYVVSGVVRSCKICKSGTRSVVAFYLPGDFFGWIDAKLSLSIEAATDTEVLFIKRSGLLSLASRNARVANILLTATTNELCPCTGTRIVDEQEREMPCRNILDRPVGATWKSTVSRCSDVTSGHC